MMLTDGQNRQQEHWHRRIDVIGDGEEGEEVEKKERRMQRKNKPSTHSHAHTHKEYSLVQRTTATLNNNNGLNGCRPTE